MTRLWITSVLTLAAAAGAAAQDLPIGKVRLFIKPDAKALQSVTKPKVFTPALELCEASGGALVGTTNKKGDPKSQVVIIDVPQADKARATRQMTDAKLAAHVADVVPAGTEPTTRITRLLVKYEPGKRPTDEQLAAAGLKPVPGKESKAGSFLVAEAATGVTAETVTRLKGIASVVGAEEEKPLSVPRPVRGAPVPAPPAAKKVGLQPARAGAITDPFFADDRQWAMKHARVASVWDAGHRKSPVVVAVIDSGVDITHPDLADNIWVNEREKTGRPGVDDDGNGRVDDVNGFDFFDMTAAMTDGGGHGTHCAGTIGAVADGKGIVGVCPQVKIMPLRFIGPSGGSNFDAILCIDYAVENGARVICASWGGYASGPDPELAAAVARARDKGVLFVAAAGNDGVDNDGDEKHYPSSFELDNVIAVMAVDPAGNIQFPADDPKWNSNFGKATVHLAAPGAKIWSTVPGGQYAEYSGTSMAAPHVAGAAALLYGHQRFATADYRAVRKALLDNVRKSNLAALKDKCVTEGCLDVSFLVSGAPPMK
jgi:subtilisin family serine protease